MISKVHLKYTPNRFCSNFYKAEISSKDQGRIVIPPAQAGASQIEDRGKAFSGFLKAFHENLRPFPRYNLKSGSKTRILVCYQSIAFGAAILIGASIFLLTVGMVYIVPVKLIILVWLIVKYIKFMKKNKPAVYTANYFPQEMLPGIEPLSKKDFPSFTYPRYTRIK